MLLYTIIHVPEAKYNDNTIVRIRVGYICTSTITQLTFVKTKKHVQVKKEAW